MKAENHRYKELGDFLKTRRAKILPSQVGLTPASRRRTPGLRREEVAQLAGIGLTWYTWLEQGRAIQVSSQVIDSLSRVLLLDKRERNYLFQLANLPLPADILGIPQKVGPILWHVLDSLVYSPALVIDQRWNVIAWNKAADVILGEFNQMNERERNIVWAMFTDIKYKELYVDWDMHAKGLLGRFRSTCGQYIEDSWFVQFVEDLKMQSEDFNLWWPLHEIQENNEVCKQLDHPDVGRLDFEVCKFEVSNHSGLTLIVHTPSPSSDTTRKMKVLLKNKIINSGN